MPTQRKTTKKTKHPRPKIKDGPGRPPKLTPAMADKIVTLASSLASDAAVCRAVGIDPGTFVDWKAYATTGREPYKTLFLRIDEAQAVEEIDLLAKIRSDPDWRAKAWVLERRTRGYEAKQKIEHTGKDGAALPASQLPPVTVVIQGTPASADNPYAPPKQG